MIITPEQIRAARALLRLDQDELARRAQVSVVTIRRIEAAEGSARVAAATLGGVRQALEEAGVQFIIGGVRQRPELTPDQQARFEAAEAISLRSAEELRGRVLLTDDDMYDENGLPAE
ncbi:helix-turn-helix domain-containing protein [Acidisoma cladoniae]|jgi:transcriptional regulator with XRE-family HTH domain|uniref:helix-turn-helix domain-containing protein n=1 Tax=Acidisoma cladoniae TaxID=3040935 RepID=UPI00254FB02D|nr:helix-turn-helix domain-containing protein [Acidisoma sp. PAMC 29798]